MSSSPVRLPGDHGQRFCADLVGGCHGGIDVEVSDEHAAKDVAELGLDFGTELAAAAYEQGIELTSLVGGQKVLGQCLETRLGRLLLVALFLTGHARAGGADGFARLVEQIGLAGDLIGNLHEHTQVTAVGQRDAITVQRFELLNQRSKDEAGAGVEEKVDASGEIELFPDALRAARIDDPGSSVIALDGGRNFEQAGDVVALGLRLELAGAEFLVNFLFKENGLFAMSNVGGRS